jgi:hypothetical protein
VLPDLRNKFILGAATSGTGSGVATPPEIGQAGSSHTANLAHTHTIAHTHTVAAHTHGYGFPDHTHRFIDPIDGTLQRFHQRGSGVKLRADDPGSTWRQGAYLAGINSAFAPNTTHDSGPIDMEPKGGVIALTTEASPATGAASAANSGSALSATQDIRPAYVGLLKLVKVRFE